MSKKIDQKREKSSKSVDFSENLTYMKIPIKKRCGPPRSGHLSDSSLDGGDGITPNFSKFQKIDVLEI